MKTLTAKAVQNIVNAHAFAACKRVPLTALVTMRLAQSASCPPDDAAPWLGRLLDKTCRWFGRQDVEPAYVMVRERGARLGDHAHVLLHVPDLRRMKLPLLDFIASAGRFEDAPSGAAVNISAGRFGMFTKPMAAGALMYVLKAAEPAIADQLGIRREPSMHFAGRAFSTSENIGAAARAAAGWREIAEPAALRRYLNP